MYRTVPGVLRLVCIPTMIPVVFDMCRLADLDNRLRGNRTGSSYSGGVGRSYSSKVAVDGSLQILEIETHLLIFGIRIGF